MIFNLKILEHETIAIFTQEGPDKLSFIYEKINELIKLFKGLKPTLEDDGETRYKLTIKVTKDEAHAILATSEALNFKEAVERRGTRAREVESKVQATPLTFAATSPSEVSPDTIMASEQPTLVEDSPFQPARKRADGRSAKPLKNLSKESHKLGVLLKSININLSLPGKDGKYHDCKIDVIKFANPEDGNRTLLKAKQLLSHIHIASATIRRDLQDIEDTGSEENQKYLMHVDGISNKGQWAWYFVVSSENLIKFAKLNDESITKEANKRGYKSPWFRKQFLAKQLLDLIEKGKLPTTIGLPAEGRSPNVSVADEKLSSPTPAASAPLPVRTVPLRPSSSRFSSSPEIFSPLPAFSRNSSRSAFDNLSVAVSSREIALASREVALASREMALSSREAALASVVSRTLLVPDPKTVADTTPDAAASILRMRPIAPSTSTHPVLLSSLPAAASVVFNQTVKLISKKARSAVTADPASETAVVDLLPDAAPVSAPTVGTSLLDRSALPSAVSTRLFSRYPAVKEKKKAVPTAEAVLEELDLKTMKLIVDMFRDPKNHPEEKAALDVREKFNILQQDEFIIQKFNKLAAEAMFAEFQRLKNFKKHNAMLPYAELIKINHSTDSETINKTRMEYCLENLPADGDSRKLKQEIKKYMTYSIVHFPEMLFSPSKLQELCVAVLPKVISEEEKAKHAAQVNKRKRDETEIKDESKSITFDDFYGYISVLLEDLSEEVVIVKPRSPQKEGDDEIVTLESKSDSIKDKEPNSSFKIKTVFLEEKANIQTIENMLKEKMMEHRDKEAKTPYEVYLEKNEKAIQKVIARRVCAAKPTKEAKQILKKQKLDSEIIEQQLLISGESESDSQPSARKRRRR